MHDVGLTHVALPAADLEASIAFYAKYARMQVVHRRDGALWLSDKTRPFVVVLLEVEDVERTLGPFAHLGVGCESLAELFRLCRMAEEDGCLVNGPIDSGPPVGTWAFLHDPDGHTLELSFGQEVGLAVSDP